MEAAIIIIIIIIIKKKDLLPESSFSVGMNRVLDVWSFTFVEGRIPKKK